LGLSHSNSYIVHRGGCLELYYCNMVESTFIFAFAASVAEKNRHSPSLSICQEPKLLLRNNISRSIQTITT